MKRGRKGRGTRGAENVPPSLLELGAPRDLVAHRFDIGEDAFAVLEFPLADLVAPLLLARLSATEQSVMLLLLDGKSNQEIARVRRRAVRTVANQVASIFRKLGIGSRNELYALSARAARSPR